MIERSKSVAQQVYDLLVERLQGGHYAPDERMPSEQQFAEEFTVSRATVRSALGKLEAQGLVLRRQGDGTYASPNAMGIRLQSHSEWQIVQQIQASGRSAAVEVLSLERQPAAPQEADELQIESGQQLLRLRYRFRADDVPVMIALYTIPAALMKPFDPKKDLAQPLVNFMGKHSKHSLGYGQVQFNALPAPEAIATDLDVPVGSPLLELWGTVYSPDALPLFHSREYYLPGEGLRFRILDQ